MNIFVVSPDPVECAKALDDLRLNKMIIETAQLLSSAARFHGYVGDGLYKTTHKNHPCTLWTQHSESNFRWLVKHFEALVDERYQRTGKTHATYIKIWPNLTDGWNLIPKGPQTPWPNCTPNKHIADVHEAYKVTMIDKWANDKRPPKWTNANKPSWA